MRLTAKAAEVLGEREDVERFKALAEAIRVALLDEYITPNGNLCIDTQTGYVLALYYGVYRDKEKLIQGFKRRLERDFFRITCGFTGAPLMLPVLLDNGLKDVAYRMLLTEEFPGWLYAVNLGATTIWERWNSLEADGTISGTGMNSLNHYAYGSVCEAVYSRIIGLQNAAPGWKRAVITPRIDARLHHASIEYDSPAGLWRVAWRIEKDGSATLTATVPEGATAHVVLPDHPEGFEADVGAGEHEWRWMPAVDWLHSFSSESRMMDLLDNADAAAILRERVPALFYACQGRNNELRVKRPMEVANVMPLDRDAIWELDAPLRAVSFGYSGPTME